MPSSFTRNAIVLGLLTAIGPFAIDMYLPALPAISAHLEASTAATQATLMAFFVAFGICQIAYGPISDMVGRKPPLYVGLSLFFVASIGCVFSPTIGWLIAFRFLQGVGASAIMAVPRAIIRDLHTGLDATRLMSLVMLVFSVSPILAPLIGSALIVPFGWRAVFVAISIAAALGLLLVAFVTSGDAASSAENQEQPQKRPGRLQHPDTGSTLLGADFYWRVWHGELLRISGKFVIHLHQSFWHDADTVQSGIRHQRNRIHWRIAVQRHPFRRFGVARVVSIAVASYTAMAVLLFVITAAGVADLAVLMTLIFLAFTWLGLVIPLTMVLALEEHGRIAGMASALGGTLQMLTGAAVIVAVSLFFNGTALPMVATIALCALAAFTLSRFTLRGGTMVAKPAE